MRVIVTGGAGFIGSHLVDALVVSGYNVTVIDNLSTGNVENIAELVERGKITWIEGDVRDRELMAALMAGADYVYHLAASVGVGHIMQHLVASIENNIDGTVSVLEAAAGSGARVLVTSTSEVYGKSNSRPSREDDDLRMGATVKSRWSYACSKALDEYLAFAYMHERELPVTVVRLFNTVGERQTDAYGMVIPTFVRQALAGKPLTIHGDGEQVRCFGYVRDVVDALQKLLESPRTIGEVYNVGSDEAVTISELADLVLEITGSSSEKQFIPYDEAYKTGFEDAQRRQPDITKVQQAIGWQPQTLLRDIVTLVTAWEREGAKVLV